MSAAVRRAPGLAGPLAISLLLHAGLVLSVVIFKVSGPPAMPPMYRVDLVAAPPGERAVGVVRDTPSPEEPSKAPAKAETREVAKAAPINPPSRTARPTTRATTNITKTPEKVSIAKAPTAGGGAIGGAGTDVATVRTEGIEFPFPGYLQHIVRQIALNFRPRNPGALKAEVFFFIRRDGSVDGFRFVTRSGNFAFDLEVEGAVEAAKVAFGALPAGFRDDILPISFSFDPARLR